MIINPEKVHPPADHPVGLKPRGGALKLDYRTFASPRLPLEISNSIYGVDQALM